MKKLLVLMLLPFIMEGQIGSIEKKESPTITRIGHFKRSDFDKGRLEFITTKQDSSIVISYYNQKYKTLKDEKYFIFKGGQKEVNELYEIMMSFYSEENKSNDKMELKFNLGKTEVTLSRSGKSVFFWTAEGYFILDRGNIKSLFGK